MRAVAGPTDAELAAREREARARLAPISAEYPFTPRFLAQPGGTSGAGVLQHYLDEGPRESRAVLFVHGNPTWSFAWRRALRGLASRVRCVAPDHIGCGLSDKPQVYPYGLGTHVENLERLVLALGVERLTLVVHDWGGPIGLGFARRHPELVERLVVANTAAFPSAGAPVPPLDPPTGIPPTPGGLTNGTPAGFSFRLPLRLAACRVPLLGALAVRGFNAFARGAIRSAVEKPLSAAARRGYLLPLDSWRSRVAVLAFVQDIPLAPGDPSWGELAAIERSLENYRDRPALILWGERDWVFTPRFRDQWERRLPGARAVRFERAGHWLFEDEPEAFARELTAFVDS